MGGECLLSRARREIQRLAAGDPPVEHGSNRPDGSNAEGLNINESERGFLSDTDHRQDAREEDTVTEHPGSAARPLRLRPRSTSCVTLRIVLTLSVPQLLSLSV